MTIVTLNALVVVSALALLLFADNLVGTLFYSTAACLGYYVTVYAFVEAMPERHLGRVLTAIVFAALVAWPPIDAVFGASVFERVTPRFDTR